MNGVTRCGRAPRRVWGKRQIQESNINRLNGIDGRIGQEWNVKQKFRKACGKPGYLTPIGLSCGYALRDDVGKITVKVSGEQVTNDGKIVRVSLSDKTATQFDIVRARGLT